VEQSCIGHLLASRFRDTNSSHGVQFMKGLPVQDILGEWGNWVNIYIFLKPRMIRFRLSVDGTFRLLSGVFFYSLSGQG
jgi:hypothetical protein